MKYALLALALWPLSPSVAGLMTYSLLGQNATGVHNGLELNRVNQYIDGITVGGTDVTFQNWVSTLKLELVLPR